MTIDKTLRRLLTRGIELGECLSAIDTRLGYLIDRTGSVRDEIHRVTCDYLIPVKNEVERTNKLLLSISGTLTYIAIAMTVIALCTFVAALGAVVGQ